MQWAWGADYSPEKADEARREREREQLEQGLEKSRTGFGARLHSAMRRHGPLCAGLDPHRSLVEQWGLTYDLDGLRAFTDAWTGDIDLLVNAFRAVMESFSV